MRIAGLVQDSIVDGPGLRFVVFTQGCTLRCTGCHNPDTWDPDGGREMPVGDIIEEMLSNPLTDGLTLSGGEPFEQAADCAGLAAAALEKGLNVWVFTGRTYENLLMETVNDPAAKALMENTNVLVDGAFIHKERTYTKKWCASGNQRVIEIRAQAPDDCT